MIFRQQREDEALERKHESIRRHDPDWRAQRRRRNWPPHHSTPIYIPYHSILLDQIIPSFLLLSAIFVISTNRVTRRFIT
jgi:hypothetical protein